MKTQHAEDLAKEYGFETKEEYFDYITESAANGQRKQTKELFMQMDDHDKIEFATSYLNPMDGIEKTTLNLCITALILQ